jgi:FSR family fosmidomycin resistance protein-like MFS transporter
MTSDSRAAAVALPAPVTVTADRSKPDMRLLGLLALGHMVIDINQGSLAAILPLLKSSLALSFTATGAIVLVANTTSSLIQPLFGYLADKTSRRWLLPLSVALSAIGIGLIGLAPSYAAVLALVVITGFGVAAYHPEGYRTATAVAGDKKATGVSIFSTGGNIGIAVGPLLATALIARFGLPGSLGMLIPGLLVAACSPRSCRCCPPRRPCAPRRPWTSAPRWQGRWACSSSSSRFARGRRSGSRPTCPSTDRGAARRSHHGRDPARRLLGAGVLGTLAAGPIADRVGMRRFMVSTLLLIVPIAVSFLFVSRPYAVLVLGILGFVLVSTFTVSVVLGQAYMPRNPGMASGMIVGFAIGAGGLGATALGGIADRWGLASALWISAVMPLGAFVAALFLPEPRAR